MVSFNNFNEANVLINHLHDDRNDIFGLCLVSFGNKCVMYSVF